MIEYTDHVNGFFFELAMKFFKNTNNKKYIIKLVKYKQLSYKPIYTFNQIKLEILKIYFIVYFNKTRFIQFF